MNNEKNVSFEFIGSTNEVDEIKVMACYAAGSICGEKRGYCCTNPGRYCPWQVVCYESRKICAKNAAKMRMNVTKNTI
nr:Amb p V allergen [Ambrosia psilostachya]